MSSGNGPRYAPEDPTLPKPWRGLIDGKTGYLYFWNPETNVTQYERPVAKTSSGLPPPTRSSSASGGASAHAHRSSSEHGHRHDDGRYNGSRSHHDQSSRGNSSHAQNLPNGSAATGYGASQGSDHGYTSHSAKPSSKLVPSNAGGGLSVESYRRQHEITVMTHSVDKKNPFLGKIPQFSDPLPPLNSIDWLVGKLGACTSILKALHPCWDRMIHGEQYSWYRICMCAMPMLSLLLCEPTARPWENINIHNVGWICQGERCLTGYAYWILATPVILVNVLRILVLPTTTREPPGNDANGCSITKHS